MRKLSIVLTFIATIMLIGAGAGVAAAAVCDPCPPDCPMMAQMMEQAAADEARGKPPSDHPDDPCKQAVLCHTAVAAPMPAEGAAPARLALFSAGHEAADALAPPSRPPDRALRPPIRL